FRLDTVRKMARGRDVGKAAPAIGDFLVLGKNVGNERKGAQMLRKRLGQSLRRGFAHLLRWMLQQIERRLDGKRSAAGLEAQVGDGLVEQSIPRGIGRYRLLVEQLLDAILELIRLLLANVFEPRAIMPQRRLLHGGFELCILDAIELEHEK